MNIYIEYICWGIFGLTWIIGALYNYYRVPVLKRKESNSKSSWSIIIGITIYYILTYIPGNYWRYITYNAGWLKITGSLILVLATSFTIWSRIKLGRMWAGDAVIKEEHRLRTDGPYSVSRHPIYTGLTVMLIGTTFINSFGSVLILALIVFLYLLFKIKNEEKLLMETFGKEYQEYMKRTPQLFPSLKSFRYQD